MNPSVEDFLSEPWLERVLDAAKVLPGLTGMSAVVNFEFATGKSSKKPPMRFHAALKDGRLVELGLGKLPEASCSVACKLPQALAIVKGEAEAEVGYMQGWLKVEGDYGVLVFGLRPLYEQPEWKDFKQAVDQLTKDN